MLLSFEWDPAKERANIRKHRLSFRQATTVFADPHQLSLYDQEHSTDEERWITLALDNTGVLCVVIHTFEQIEEGMCQIRIISARRASKSEEEQYLQANP